LTDEQIANLVERGMLPQGTKPLYAPSTEPKFPEHPTASWLYRKFKAGTDTLTKDEAYRVGNQLDAQRVRIKRLEAEIDALRSAGGDMVRKIMAAKESLTRLP
jgi:hypothetical protein